MGFLVLSAMVLPLLFVTWILGKSGRQHFQHDLEKLLHEMDFETVRMRVVWAGRHTAVFGVHAALLLIFFLATSDNHLLSGWRVLWIYVVFLHALSLYLYFQRWNPTTLERKRKIDLGTLLETETTFDPTATYIMGADGELIRVEESLPNDQKATAS